MLFAVPVSAQESEKALYDQIKNFCLNWAMVLPVSFDFGGDRAARTTLSAYGPKTPFNIKLPRRPKKVEFDPQKWVLSEKTSTKGN